MPSKIDLIVSKMMAKDVKYRYSTCAEVIDALEPLGLANETLSFIAVDAPEHAESEDTRLPTPTQLAGRAAAAKTSTPRSGKDTDAPEDEADPDAWFMQLKTKTGKDVTKKVTTDQIRTMIKAGHIQAERKSANWRSKASVQPRRTTNSKATSRPAKPPARPRRKVNRTSKRTRTSWPRKIAANAGAGCRARSKAGWRFVIGMTVIGTVLGGVGFALWYGYNNFIK